MPHHAVIRREAVTTKLRVVFDASSHALGHPCLNDVLFKGTKLGVDIVQLLLTFRCHPVVLIADIKNAYLQMLIRPEDRDVLRFLWIDRLPSDDDPSPSVVTWRMTRVPLGASSSPFLLAATIRHHLALCREQHPETVALLEKAFYVDDLIVGLPNADEAATVYNEARKIFSEASMELRKWASNAHALREIFLRDKIAFEDEAGETTLIKVLGVPWEREGDRIVLMVREASDFAANKPSTKRIVIQTLARVYDPLGYLASFSLRAKVLFQDLWKKKCAWDDALPPEEQASWNSWRTELASMNPYSADRYVFLQSADATISIELHVFCDASPRAYGTCIYARALSPNGACNSQLLISKSRVAPLKHISLPRLGLLACVVGARLCAYVKTVPVLSSVPVHFWTDSLVALHWIRKTPAKRELFVRHRVSEIHSLTSPTQWHHCSGKDNPADLVTRGVSSPHLLASTMWWHGPTWLHDPEEPMPTERAELSEEFAVFEQSPEETSVCPAGFGSNAILSVSKYSNLNRLLRVTGRVYRFAANASKKQCSTAGPLTAAELHKAEHYWLQRVQEEMFSEEVQALRAEKELPSTSPVLRLHPFLHEGGLLRVGGRLQELAASFDVKHPILLPARHTFTHLVVSAAHGRVLHSGVEATLCELREKFWVVKGRQTVKRVLRSCLPCKRYKPVAETSPFAPLPRDRITEASPFFVVGLDFCGPLYTRDTAATSRKAYILMFSCAVTRAIHLELTTDMTTTTTLFAFRRFISRRGIPDTVYSDNALSFHGSARVPKTILPALREYAANTKIKWKFIAERAPWWGGWWERLIRSTKNALKRSLGRNSLDAEALATVLCEVEAVINSRPLTDFDSSPDELQPLTPSHFLLGRRLICLPQEVGNSYGMSSTREDLICRARYRERLTAELWSRWKRSYLLLLRSAHNAPHRKLPRLHEGDVVLVHDEGTHPLLWKLGKVLAVHPGRDNIARICTLRLASGHTIKRPVQKLHILEASQRDSTAS